MGIGIFGKYYDRPAPRSVKFLWYAVSGVLIYLFMNIDQSPLSDGALKSWLKFLGPGIIVALNILRDGIGVKTLQDKVDDKNEKIR